MSVAADVRLAFARQIAWCREMDAPSTARIVAAVEAALVANDDVARLLPATVVSPTADAVPLRFAGALHALALRDPASALGVLCASDAFVSDDLLDATVREALVVEREFVGAFVRRPPQTNEVGRAGIVLGGLLEVAASTALPLRLLEIGASAGLNLTFDRYAYRLGEATWGGPSAVLLAPAWTGPSPSTGASLVVAARAGCDLTPVDLSDASDRLRLAAYAWVDHRERAARLDAAIDVAVRARVNVDRADAEQWLAAHLATRTPDVASVVMHTIVWQYLSVSTRLAIREMLAAAGEVATTRAPLAWLRFEPPDAGGAPELRLTTWPGRGDRRLATAHPHGTWVRWDDA